MSVVHLLVDILFCVCMPTCIPVFDRRAKMPRRASQMDSDQDGANSFGSSVSMGTLPAVTDPIPTHQALLLDICSSIGEPDSLYSACIGSHGDGAARLRMYEHEKEWYKALGKWFSWQHAKSVG